MDARTDGRGRTVTAAAAAAAAVCGVYASERAGMLASERARASSFIRVPPTSFFLPRGRATSVHEWPPSLPPRPRPPASSPPRFSPLSQSQGRRWVEFRRSLHRRRVVSIVASTCVGEEQQNTDDTKVDYDVIARFPTRRGVCHVTRISCCAKKYLRNELQKKTDIVHITL